MNRARHPPLLHPLAPLFDRAVDSLGAALSPESHRHYRGTVRNFLRYLGAAHPEVNSLEQLRREPHLLGWMSRLRSQTPPLATSSYINRLIALRPLLTELAWTEQLPQLARLIRREDIPRLPQRLARPLTAEQDQLLQQEFVKRNDWESNTFLLIRHTGMRIGECADLSFDCLRSTGPNQWRDSRAARQTQNRTDGPGGFVGGDGRPTLTLLSLPRSAPSRWPAPGPAQHPGCPRSSTAPVSAPGLSFSEPFRTHRPAPVETHLRHGDASRRGQFSRADEITRPHLSGHDDALCRSGAD